MGLQTVKWIRMKRHWIVIFCKHYIPKHIAEEYCVFKKLLSKSGKIPLQHGLFFIIESIDIWLISGILEQRQCPTNKKGKFFHLYLSLLCISRFPIHVVINIWFSGAHITFKSSVLMIDCCYSHSFVLFSICFNCIFVSLN